MRNSVAVVRTEEQANKLINHLIPWFGGEWSYCKGDMAGNEEQGYTLQVKGLETFREEKARYFIIGYLAAQNND